MVWRPILAGKVTLGEVERGEVSLDRLLRLNAWLDYEAAVQDALAPRKE